MTSFIKFIKNFISPDLSNLSDKNIPLELILSNISDNNTPLELTYLYNVYYLDGTYVINIDFDTLNKIIMEKSNLIKRINRKIVQFGHTLAIYIRNRQKYDADKEICDFTNSYKYYLTFEEKKVVAFLKQDFYNRRLRIQNNKSGSLPIKSKIVVNKTVEQILFPELY